METTSDNEEFSGTSSKRKFCDGDLPNASNIIETLRKEGLLDTPSSPSCEEMESEWISGHGTVDLRGTFPSMEEGRVVVDATKDGFSKTFSTSVDLLDVFSDRDARDESILGEISFHLGKSTRGDATTSDASSSPCETHVP
jgi:hypothetical protein